MSFRLPCGHLTDSEPRAVQRQDLQEGYASLWCGQCRRWWRIPVLEEDEDEEEGDEEDE
jgi:hypothetical protein